MKCWRCLFVKLFFLKIKNNCHYWQMTNFFVLMRGGKDYCEYMK
jgi:hypothetical protein